MTAHLSHLNGFFAKCRFHFANDGRALLLGAVSLSAALIASLAGAFGTGALAIVPRTAFWVLSIMPIWLFWELWFVRWLGRGWSWQRTLLVGLPLVLAVIPLEVMLLLSLFGVETAPLANLFLRSAAIVLVLLPIVLIFAARIERAVRRRANPPARFRGTAIALDEIAALVAEDHYVRIHLTTGGSRLIRRRFRDAIVDLGETDGQQVHRGAWIAESCRSAAQRQGERWFIAVSPELSLPVSRSHAARLR